MIANMLGKSFVFVGTRLSEPPFYHYLRLRSERERGVPEHRAKAFLVSPNLSPIYRRQFEDQNFVVIDATAQEFFDTLIPAVHTRVPTRLDLLKNRYPHQIAAINEGAFDAQSEVLRQFELVSGEAQRDDLRSQSYFYDGAEPSWNDIRRQIDAERDITQQFLDALTRNVEGVHVFAIVGHAGSGKSTTAKRVAFELFRDGRTVYFATTPQKLNIQPILNLVESLASRHVFLFLDDARWHVSAISRLLRSLPTGANVTLVLIDRKHILHPKLQRAQLKTVTLEMPVLVRSDCERIIAKLEQFGLLGALQGLTRQERLREFLVRSRKQLLVAMKEATSGHGFDVIIEDEYRTLVSDNARLAYAITCLAYVHGVPVRRRHLIACLDGTDIEKANTLESDLNGVVVSWGNSDHLLSPRHRVIADRVITGPVSAVTREEAVKRFLAQISSDINPTTIRRRTAEFTAYRGIINFDSMLELFGPDYHAIDAIYEELRHYYGEDYLFWLQYGRAQVHFDNFSLAENYLNQSLGIRQNYQAQHYMGVLFLKRALYWENAGDAATDLRKGEEVLRQQIRDRGDKDPYPYAALITHKFRYLRKYGSTNLQEELTELKELAEIAVTRYPLHEALRDTYQEVLRAYLSLALHEEAPVDDIDDHTSDFTDERDH
jgi:ABC-type phosphonate transport system ATPase subunit